MPFTILPLLLLTGGMLHLLQGLRTIINPKALLPTFGLPLDASAVEFVPAYGGRNVALSLTMLVFWWHSMHQAAGLMLICCTVGALVDAFVALMALSEGRVTNRGPMYSHLGGFLVLGALGWALATHAIPQPLQNGS